MNNRTTIGILGSGTWGIALARLLHRNGHDVTVWSRSPKKIENLSATRTHPALPGLVIPETVHFTCDLQTVASGKDILLFAVPSIAIRQTAESARPFIPDGQIIVDVAKGIEPDTLMTMTEVIRDELSKDGQHDHVKLVALSGPTHAEEVSRGIPTTIVAGSKSKSCAEYVQNLFMNEVFRVYTSPDVLGIELGGALKNVVALAAGIADGLGYGDNTKAALITRGITEIARLGTAMGGNFETFCGLTGIGDLIVTCASMHSRNRRAGILIGQGKTYEEAMKEVQMVVEGVYSAKAAMELSKKYDVQLPIIEQVNEVLFDGKPADQAVKELMLRDKKLEVSHLPWPEE